MATKVILVTGGNKGIGLAIVESLLQQEPDSVVLLGSRDEARGRAAVEGVLARLGPAFRGRLQLLLIDVTSQASVDEALATVIKDHSNIYGVINNAGGMGGGARDTVELNTYGVRRVSEAFAPIIQDGGRIVQVSSAAGPMFVQKCEPEMQKFCVNPDVTWEEVEETLIQPYLAIVEGGESEDKAAAMKAKGFGSEGNMGDYGLSKAAVNCYTMALARQFPRLTITSCTPGFIETDLTRGFATKAGKTPAEMGMLGTEKVKRQLPTILWFQR
jgi:NAD(P)-dependent dehydrogenase (short-subunit alcohol dehydrogenase family)